MIIDNKKRGAKPGNINATKPHNEKSESFIHARCKSEDKAAWVKAAQSEEKKLTEWIVDALNAKAKNT